MEEELRNEPNAVRFSAFLVTKLGEEHRPLLQLSRQYTLELCALSANFSSYLKESKENLLLLIGNYYEVTDFVSEI